MTPGRPLSLGLAALNVATLVGGVTLAGVLRHENQPGQAVRTFLDALADGDVTRALDLVTQREEKDVALLGKGVLPKGSRITDPHLVSVEQTDDDAVVAVTFKVKGAELNARYTLKRPRRTGIGATDWQITNALTNLEITDADGFDTITVNGQRVSLTRGRAEHVALPGYYQGTLPSSELFTAHIDGTAVGATETFLTAQVDVRPAVESRAKKAALEGVRSCLAKVHDLKERCGLVGLEEDVKKAQAQGVVFDDAHWRVLEFPSDLVVVPDLKQGALLVFSFKQGYAKVDVRVSAPAVNPGYSTRVTDVYPFLLRGVLALKKGQLAWADGVGSADRPA